MLTVKSNEQKCCRGLQGVCGEAKELRRRLHFCMCPNLKPKFFFGTRSGQPARTFQQKHLQCCRLCSRSFYALSRTCLISSDVKLKIEVAESLRSRISFPEFTSCCWLYVNASWRFFFAIFICLSENERN